MTAPTVIATIVSHTPFWVWPLLALLVALGLRATRPRTVTPGRLLVLPAIMFALSASAAFSGPQAGFVLPVYGLALALGAALGHAVGRSSGARPGGKAGTIALPGEWWTLGLELATFAGRYAFAASAGFDPALAHATVFVLARITVMGALGGVFAGRAVTLVLLGRPGALATSGR